MDFFRYCLFELENLFLPSLGVYYILGKIKQAVYVTE